MPFILLLAGCGQHRREADTERYLRQLDSIVERGSALAPRTTDAPERGTAGREGAAPLQDPFEREMALHDEYMSRSLDSALMHVKRAREIAGREGAAPLQVRADIALAYVYNTSGVMYKEAYDIFTGIDRSLLTDSAMLFDWYCLGIQVNRNLAVHSLDEELKAQYTAAKAAWRDSALTLKPDNDVLLANKYMDLGDYGRALQVLGNVRDGQTTREAAIKYNVLAQIYERQGRTDLQEKYLAQSAICDLSNGVREYLSLQTLAMLLYDDGDYSRAYRYIHRSIADATACNAKLRMLEMSETLPIIDNAYDAAQRRTRLTIILACVAVGLLLVVLAIALLYIRRKNRRLASISRRLEASAQRLEASDRIKQEYVTRFMNLCLEYLGKMEHYRGHLNKVAATGDWQKLYDTIRSTRYVNKEIADFYEKFDEAFLNLFPTFVDDVNALLRPDGRPRLKNGERLNTELRILALMRLGITDGESICRFLRCSASTVYNYRTRLRNAALDRSAFDRAITPE